MRKIERQTIYTYYNKLINTMFKNLLSGNQYIFTRKQPNNANIETFCATFQDIVNSTLRVTNVYDQSMNLQCCMRTMPIEWIISICPLDNQQSIWYPSEEICRSGKQCKHQIVKTQRKIAKKTKSKNTYYNTAMLDRNIYVYASIEGINPNWDEKIRIEREKSWLNSSCCGNKIYVKLT